MLREQVLKKAEKCLDEMYRKAIPSITWKEYVERYSNSGIEGFRNHKLEENRLTEIWKKHEKKIPQFWRASFDMFVMSYSPISLGSNRDIFCERCNGTQPNNL